MNNSNVIVRVGEIIHVMDENQQCRAAIVIEVISVSGRPSIATILFTRSGCVPYILNGDNYHRLQECPKEMYY